MQLDQAYFDERTSEPGYFAGCGGVVEIPPGEHELVETIHLGDGTPKGSRPCITIRGAGMGNVSGDGQAESWGGTIVRWAGPAGAPMIVGNGVPYLKVRDLGFRLDAVSGDTASHGLIVSGDSARGGPTFQPSIRDVCFDAKREVSNDSIGLYVTGANYADQVDGVEVVHCSFTGLGFGYVQDSSQTVWTRVVGCNFSNFLRNVQVREGSLRLEACLLQMRQWDGQDDFININPTRHPHQQWGCSQQVIVESCHMEQRAGKFYVADTGGSPRSFQIRNSMFQLQQVDGNEMLIIESDCEGPLTLSGNIVSSQYGCPARVRKTGTGPIIARGEDYHRKGCGPITVETNTVERLVTE